MLLDRRSVLLAGLAMPAVLAGRGAAGQTESWPSRPIRLVVPFPPGGSTDIFARLVAEPMGRRLGQPIVVENRAGAGGIIGTDVVVKSAPDGYTIVVGTVSSAAINYPLFGSRMPYAADELTGIGLIVAQPNVLVVKADSRFRSLQDLLDYGRANSGKLNYGVTGPGSSVTLTGLLMNLTANLDVAVVPFRGSAPLLQELIAGRIDYAVDGVTTSAPFIREGVLRALAVTQADRIAMLPDVPTTHELGLPQASTSPSWFGLLAPARTPRPVVEKLGDALQASLAEPALQARLVELGSVPVAIPGGRNTPAGFDAFIKEEISRWGDIVRRTGATPD